MVDLNNRSCKKYILFNLKKRNESIMKKQKYKIIPCDNLCIKSEHNSFCTQVALVCFPLPHPNTSIIFPCSLVKSGKQGKRTNQIQVIVQNMFYEEGDHMVECDMVF